MASEYSTYYVKDLVSLIQNTALDLMGEPVLGGKKMDGTLMTLQEVSNQNSLIAMNNAGIRLMAKELIRQLQGDEDE